MNLRRVCFTCEYYNEVLYRGAFLMTRIYADLRPDLTSCYRFSSRNRVISWRKCQFKAGIETPCRLFG